MYSLAISNASSLDKRCFFKQIRKQYNLINHIILSLFYYGRILYCVAVFWIAGRQLCWVWSGCHNCLFMVVLTMILHGHQECGCILL
jgi:hypothetical protein